MRIEGGLLFSACLLSLLICCYSFQYENHTLRCNDHIYKYVPDRLFCDGRVHCHGGEDEGLGCVHKPGAGACGAGKFSCDGKCMNMTVRCNTIKDCRDGTDELNCGDDVNVKNCTSDDKFLCKDGLRCLGMEYTCDDACNCFDCSDENSNCLKTDPVLLKKCPNAYFRTPDGPRCFCESNITNSSNSTFCGGITNCKYYSSLRNCDQHCIRFQLKLECSCYEGYQPTNEILGTPCRSTDNFQIIYATEDEIKSLNNTSLMTSTILHGIANCTLVKAANNYVYYATLSHDNKGSIFKVAINSDKAEKLIETNFPITSMAVDYITNNVYFTSNGSLSVCKSNGQLCMQLKCCNITSVTLAPKSGWIFYLQMETRRCQTGSFLTRLNMDGSNETMNHNNCYEGNFPIEMDESKNILYLLQKYNNNDEFNPILKISVDPEFKNSSHFDDFNNIALGQIKHFSFYNNGMFFTILPRNGIFYYSNSTSRDYSTFRRDSPPIYLNDNSTSAISGLYVYNAATQLSEENPCEKSSCSGLCLLKPEVRQSKYFLNHSCFCDHFNATDVNRRSSNGTEGAVGTDTLNQQTPSRCFKGL